MTRRYIKHASKEAADRRSDAINAAIGYPTRPKKRGRRCPPEPFGVTVRWGRVVQDPSDGAWMSPEAPSRVVGTMERVRGQDVIIDNAGMVQVEIHNNKMPTPE